MSTSSRLLCCSVAHLAFLFQRFQLFVNTRHFVTRWRGAAIANNYKLSTRTTAYWVVCDQVCLLPYPALHVYPWCSFYSFARVRRFRLLCPLAALVSLDASDTPCCEVASSLDRRRHCGGHDAEPSDGDDDDAESDDASSAKRT